MASQEPNRIDELRGRIQKDPASIAFAQLAEEYRRAGRFGEAIETCRNGLVRHPGYVSARVTLGRALLEIGELGEAHRELSEVLKQAPENLAAIRGLAEVHRRRGEVPEAIEQFRSAFELAGADPGIDQLVKDLRRESAAEPIGPIPSIPPRAAQPAMPQFDTLPVPAPPVPRETPERARARTVTGYLQRWLEAIMADRRSRLYGAQA